MNPVANEPASPMAPIRVGIAPPPMRNPKGTVNATARLRALGGVFTGALTLLLGPLSDHWLSVAALVLPLLAVWLFLAAFAAIAMITPPNARNLAVAFTVPFGFLIGGGAIPTLIGAMGDAGSFATGFMLTGALIASGGILGCFSNCLQRATEEVTVIVFVARSSL